MKKTIDGIDKTKIEEYRDRYFRMATSTKPADRPSAEAAALRMADIAGIKCNEVHWIDCPNKLNSFKNSFKNSGWNSIRCSLKDSLCGSLWGSLRESESISDSLMDLLWESLSYSLLYSLWCSLWDLIFEQLWYSIKNSLWNSLRDSRWIAYYMYIMDVLKIDIEHHNVELLRLYNQIASSCFAIWIVPDAIILCERPEEIEIINGKLVNLKWRLVHDEQPIQCLSI